MLYTVYEEAVKQGIEGVFIVVGLFEILSMVFQIVIFHIVYSSTDKKAGYKNFVLCWIIINPIQVLGGFSHFGSMNDCIFYLIVMISILGDD